MRPSLLLRFFAWLRGGQVIAVTDDEGDILFTIMYITPFATCVAHRHWFHKIGSFVCGDDGRAKGLHGNARWTHV